MPESEGLHFKVGQKVHLVDKVLSHPAGTVATVTAVEPLRLIPYTLDIVDPLGSGPIQVSEAEIRPI